MVNNYCEKYILFYYNLHYDYFVFFVSWSGFAQSGEYKLYQDLIRKSGYVKHMRPVLNDSTVVDVHIEFDIKQILFMVGCRTVYFALHNSLSMMMFIYAMCREERQLLKICQNYVLQYI